MKKILDACCGSKMFWFQKENKEVVFMDNRMFEVAFEERTLSYGPRKYVNVKAECCRYIKGLSEQDKERTLIEDLKRGAFRTWTINN